MAVLAEISWFSSASPSKCCVSHSRIPSLSWYLIKRRHINQEELSWLALGFSPWRSAFFHSESLMGFVVDHVGMNKIFLPVLQFKLGSHYSTEIPLSLSPRAGTVAPLAASVPRDFVLHKTQKQTESYSATEAVWLVLSVVDTYMTSVPRQTNSRNARYPLRILQIFLLIIYRRLNMKI